MKFKTSRGAVMFNNNQTNFDMDINTEEKYAIWTGDGGYFAGVFGGAKDFRNDPLMAEKYDSEYEAEQAADKLGFETPDDFEIRRVQ